MPLLLRRRSTKWALILGTVLALGATLVATVRPDGAAAQMAGVQAHLLWDDVGPLERKRQLDRAQAAGARLMRVDLGWATLEPKGKGRYSRSYLARIDAVVREAETRGIKVLFTVWTTPCWASSAPKQLKGRCRSSSTRIERYPPTNPADYADALAFLVRRYGRRVAAWEIWNEPNSSYFFKAADPAQSYARLVKTAYPAAKSADTGATVVAGSLMDSDFAFTKALYDQGIKGSFDVFSIHPYSADRSPMDRMPDRYLRNSFVRGVPAVRDVMLRNGDARSVWLTEFGWSTTTDRGGEAWENGVDPDIQAVYLEQAYRQMRSWSYVEAGVWFKLKDTSADRSDRVDNYGLLGYDGSPKPAFQAFRRVAAGGG